MPRLQFNEKLRVRQYIISDPSTVFCFEYYSSLKGYSPPDWQQQMSTTPTQFRTLDNWSDGRDLTTNYIRPLPAIPDYNPYYMDPQHNAPIQKRVSYSETLSELVTEPSRTQPPGRPQVQTEILDQLRLVRLHAPTGRDRTYRRPFSRASQYFSSTSIRHRDE